MRSSSFNSHSTNVLQSCKPTCELKTLTQLIRCTKLSTTFLLTAAFAASSPGNLSRAITKADKSFNSEQSSPTDMTSQRGSECNADGHLADVKS